MDSPKQAPWNRGMRRHTAALAVAALTCWAPSARAQRVSGSVVAADRPVEGAVVLLLDESGRVVARTVTRDDGRYALAAPVAGRYVLRALRIGFAPTTSTIVLGASESATRRIVASSVAVRLDAIRVSDRQRCRVRPDSGSEAFAVWDAARTALLATQITSASALHVAVRLTERTLDPFGRELDARVREDSGRAVQPFVSLPPDSLARVGYVVLDDDGYTAWAPDPDVLLGESFASSHCLRLVVPARGDTAHASAIGVAFEPVRGAKRADVRGTLWVDRATSRLRALDFRYANTERPIEEVEAGGDAGFLRLPDGRWIIDRWRIAAPVVETTRTPGQATTWRVTAMREFRGEVAEVRSGATSLWARERVRARALVLGAERPVPDAVVVVDGGPAVRTDSAGIAALGTLLPGIHRVVVTPPESRRDLEWTETRLVVGTTDDRLAVVRLTTTAAAVRRRCGDVKGGFLTGVVRFAGAEGAAIVGATVDVTWIEHVEVLKGNAGIAARTETRRTTSDAQGRFTVCDVPVARPLKVEARTAQRTAAPTMLTIEEGSLLVETSLFIRP